MAKKNSMMKYAGFVAILLALAAIGFMFAPAITAYADGAPATYTGPATFTAFQAMFGYTAKSGDRIITTRTWLDFSFMNLLALILIAAGIVLSVMKMFVGGKSKLFTLITTACFIVAGVFLFMTVTFTVPHVSDNTAEKFFDLTKDNMTLGWGAIVAAICSLIAGSCKLGEFLLG